jgi:hypothetical protein
MCVCRNLLYYYRLVLCLGQNKRIAPLSFFHGYRKVVKVVKD